MAVVHRFLNSLKRKGQYLSVDPSSELAETLGIESFEISKDGEYVCIDRIKVKEPKHGDGTRLMELVCKWADENGRTLTLTPSDNMGATSVARLVKFYRRFGFVENKGRKADFATRQGMYRKPNA